MKKIVIILLCLVAIVGCKSKNKDLEKIEDKFTSNGFILSFGDGGVIISGPESNSILAEVKKDGEKSITYKITYMNQMTGKGVSISQNGENEPLPNTTEDYYEKYQQLLEKMGISEKELFEFCAWKYTEFTKNINS